ncbi:unnamed protein product [Paramecium sonneborni]|uniref:PSI domain-containing protein n=1 Tax=Paramecium sonneborni TaxID=65129 RepID=A0A8S1MQK2_9CILI|nr:unnamed protein product [Paramecium sonneborni]
MLRIVLFIQFLNFIDEGLRQSGDIQMIFVNGKKDQILVKQKRFAQLRSMPELSEDDEGGDDGGGDDGGDDEIQAGGGGGPSLGGLSGGNPRDAETEENLRLDAWSIIRNLDEFMIVQNQRLMDALYGDAIEQNEEMEELIYDLTDNIDHWTYRIYSKFQKTNLALEDSRYTSAKTAIIAIDSQIRKANQQLKIYYGQLYRLQDQIPDEEEQCAQFYTCKECLTNEGCGWCPLNDKCVVGDENGPLFQQCQYYNYQFCQGKQCLKYSTCNTCLSDSECGWCQVDEDNIKVCLQQPRNFQGCPEGHWYHIAGESFACPFKSQKQKMEEDVPSHKFWMRPKAKPPQCKPVDSAMKAKIQKERQQYNDKSEYKPDQNRNKEVQLNFKNTLQQKVVQLKNLVEELIERRDDIQAWLDEYMKTRGIEPSEPVENQDQDAGEESPQENQEQQQDSSSSQGQAGNNKVQVKKEKKSKKKVVQIIAEETASPEEELMPEGMQEEQQEEVLEQGEEDVEYVFETSKEYKVDIREIHVERQKTKKVDKEEIEDKKYKDQGDRDIEGDLDTDYYQDYYKQRKKHFRDFEKYYPK